MKNIKSVLLIAFLLTAIFSAKTFAAKTDNSSTETQLQYLSGHGSDDVVLWDFFCTEGRNSGKWTKIPVPSCWELQGFGTYQYGMPFYGKADPPGIAKEQGKYKTTFKLPAEWEGRTIKLVFEGVMTDCSVDINGRRAVKLHQGAFYRFKADVTDRVFFGKKENLLEVTVSKESANPQVNLAERRADYWNFGGIFRPVFIEALPALNIERTCIDAKADGTFTAKAFLGQAPGENYKVEAIVTGKDGKQKSDIMVSAVRPGSDFVDIQGSFNNIETWTAETPALYDVTFILKNKDNVIHTIKEKFGFRTIKVKDGDGLYVNGSKILVKGINRHSFRPETGRTLSKKANYNDVRLIKEMNMNAVRLSHYPPDPEFLQACDELGLYVMNELGGWHGKYDTETGKQLIKEMLTRDANHPCIIWWSNGNEGGWNTELDGEFVKWDIQKRPVLHPQGNFGGFETMHYRSYGESQEYMRKPEIFMPTEFLHGLYDGGHGAGLWDYWEMMRNNPKCAGGFLWVLADEGVVRTDQNGRIDNSGNYGADGIVGPNHEKEGSFYTVREVWSPVQISNKCIKQDFNGEISVENRYDFISLDKCSFKWAVVNFTSPTDKAAGHKVISEGTVNGPDVKPGCTGKLNLTLPASLKSADALMIYAVDPSGETIMNWSLPVIKDCAGNISNQAGKTNNKILTERTDSLCTFTIDKTKLVFDLKTGLLTKVEKSGKPVSFGNGPQFIAARRADRSMDVFYNHDDAQAKSKERIYNDISGLSKLKKIDIREIKDTVFFKAEYTGNFVSAEWKISSDGRICLDYKYRYDGVVELAGIKFDYPENQMLSKRWLGKGPYRVWQNRTQGPVLDVWKVDYNDPIPAESFNYPEFKGYFSDWRWVDFNTTEGNFRMYNGKPCSYLGVYTPRDGRDALLYTIPQSGIAVLDVIPAVRNKVNSTDLAGPSSQAKWLNGVQSGRIWLEF